ncbi:MAG: formate dehydrogenase accessory sulfurtransferase FdhD [Firmicutes bacterium]|nr:formate dehydrogenase accessory sulfurtransferase FdhD [Bacillota bacterium]
MSSGPETKGTAANIVCDRYSNKGWLRTSAYVPTEMELIVNVNRQPLVKILCTADKLNYLVVGYLYAEGIISNIEDIASMWISKEESLAEVNLSRDDYELPTLRTLGCSGSLVFQTQALKVDSDFVVTPAEVLSLMKHLQKNMDLYQLSGGVHTSALSDNKNLLVVAEDIGRHNTLNKVQGECLLREIPTTDRLLLITGRISSEMLLKAAKMQVPIVASRRAPTKDAVTLARDLGIALVGQVRDEKLSVFTHPERLGHFTG